MINLHPLMDWILHLQPNESLLSNQCLLQRQRMSGNHSYYFWFLMLNKLSPFLNAFGKIAIPKMVWITYCTEFGLRNKIQSCSLRGSLNFTAWTSTAAWQPVPIGSVNSLIRSAAGKINHVGPYFMLYISPSQCNLLQLLWVLGVEKAIHLQL